MALRATVSMKIKALCPDFRRSRGLTSCARIRRFERARLQSCQKCNKKCTALAAAGRFSPVPQELPRFSAASSAPRKNQNCRAADHPGITRQLQGLSALPDKSMVRIRPD